MKFNPHPSPETFKANYKSYLLTIGGVALVSWTAFLLVINKLDPNASTGVALGLFFLSLFVALIATFTLIGFALRRWLGKNEVEYHHLSVSLRQGLLLSFCTTACIAFLMVGVLRWWNGLLLVTIAVLLELFLTNRQ